MNSIEDAHYQSKKNGKGVIPVKGPYPPPREHDYPIPDDKYTGNLKGGGIRHNSTHWQDKYGDHRESYNYDREGNIENLHSDRGPGPYNRR